MEKETYVRVNIALSDVRWYKQQIVVMYPYHFAISADFTDSSCKPVIDDLVFMPQFRSTEIVLEIMKSFEIVKQWSKNVFMEFHEIFNNFLFEEDWDTVILFQKLSNLVLVLLGLRVNSRPANPRQVNHVFFS